MLGTQYVKQIRAKLLVCASTCVRECFPFPHPGPQLLASLRILTAFESKIWK